MKQWNYLWI